MLTFDFSGEEFIDEQEIRSCTSEPLLAGKEFEVLLPSNPSTGYVWRVTGRPDGLLISKRQFRGFSDDPEIVGGGGQEVFVLSCEHDLPNGATLEMRKMRPWMGPQDSDPKLILVLGDSVDRYYQN